MILLTSTGDLLQVITGSAVANIVCHASWVDNASGTITPGRTNTSISTATTTTVVAAPGASTQRNLKFLSITNTHASSSCLITIQHTDGTTVVPLWKGTLSAGMYVQVDELGGIRLFSAGGIQLGPLSTGAMYASSTAAQGPGFATDTYLTGSSILIPSQRPKVGTRYYCLVSVTKTAAGTAAPVLIIRYGTNGSAADTALVTLTLGAGTAAIDTGLFEVWGVYRAVGAGTAAVMQGHAAVINAGAAGLVGTGVKGVAATSAGHDSTTASTFLGVSYNGGTSASHTVNLVTAMLENI